MNRISRKLCMFLSLCMISSAGCAVRSAIVVEELLIPIAPAVPWLPSDSDLAVARLAESALASRSLPRDDESKEPFATRSVETALARVEDSAYHTDSERIIPLAHDVRNSTLDDPIAYRKASKRLRKDYKLDPRLKTRIDRIVADDPLRLASKRQRDGWERLWARTFNAVSEPLGSSLITGFVIVPFTLANSIIHYFAEFSNSEPLSKTDRQALVHRQNFLDRHPNTELTPKLEKKIKKGTLLLEETLALRRVRLAERTFDANEPRISVVQADAALGSLKPHPEVNRQLRKRAESIRSKARAHIGEIERRRSKSLEAMPTLATLKDTERELAIRILAPTLDLAELEPSIERYVDAGGPMDRVEFVRAIALHESRYEIEARNQLERTASRRVDRSTMARHARTLADDEWQNPYRAFVRLRRQAGRDEIAWRIAGEWVKRPRYPNISAPIAYLIDTPTIAMTIILSPIRLLISPFQENPDFYRAAALAGYRYLLRFPNGVDQDEVIQWLFDYEMDHDRFGRALRLADLIPNFESDKRIELVEKTAGARHASVDRLDRRDSRAAVLKGVVREFPDSNEGHQAGLQARDEALDASAQHIRITKGFLLENPGVAGRNGMGLDPRLLNDDVGDGELHPEGVVLRGDRMLEIRLIADGGDDDDPPESRYRKIGKERLAQIASSLNAAVHRNALADLESRPTPDANRDTYLERAALGVTEDEDRRATAESSFVYESLRERYGLVRGRDSILPFDLVFRGSLGDFTLGAFPRWRAPRETPDSFLYR